MVTDGQAAFDGTVLKHLEFIQAIVTRLANNSFLLKGWALTVLDFRSYAAASSQARRMAWISSRVGWPG